MGTRITLLRPGRMPYREAWELQRRTAREVASGADPTLILLEHPPTFTLGSRGNTQFLITPEASLAALGADVIHSDRGGDITFHGPGQIVGYPIVDLRALGIGPADYVRRLEAVLIDALGRFGIAAERAVGRPGVWTRRAKIAAIGVRISRGVTTHGFALNVNTDLSWFSHIVPCGIADAGVTSMQRELGEPLEMDDVQLAMVAGFEGAFGMQAQEPMAVAHGR
jgi:lipoate-protein ligase B